MKHTKRQNPLVSLVLLCTRLHSVVAICHKISSRETQSSKAIYRQNSSASADPYFYLNPFIQLILVRAIFATLSIYIWGMLGAVLGERDNHLTTTLPTPHAKRGGESSNRGNGAGAAKAKESLWILNLEGLVLRIQPDLSQGVFEAKNQYRVSVWLINNSIGNIELVHPTDYIVTPFWNIETMKGQLLEPSRAEVLTAPEREILYWREVLIMRSLWCRGLG